ncbi:pyridoxamine 5'-phosphate oxidase [Nocardioides ginkgobilobae]
MTDLRALRHEYAAKGLDEGDLDPDPLVVFRRWFEEALASGLDEPNAMVVATVDEDGRPSARTVLLKGLEDGPDGGFVFYTNHASRKGRALAAEPRVALLFPWHPLERQVRVEGTAELLPREEVEAYFAVRPRGSQLGAHASAQSQPVADRTALEAAYAAAEREFEGREVTPPEQWGGYRVRPEVVELWQGRPSRLHDRFEYRRAGDGWTVRRLQP